ncbi:MAG: hypothetical protein R3E98_13645 [Gemmatimonadota bacterium]|nr:hypothetical protein [Gemmatimonadota bacterium]
MARFRVIDALAAPHGGSILRLRLTDGEAPALRALKGATLTAKSPDGSASRRVRVEGFPVMWGKPSDARVKASGRVDVHVKDLDGAGEPIWLKWQVEGP